MATKRNPRKKKRSYRVKKSVSEGRRLKLQLKGRRKERGARSGKKRTRETQISEQFDFEESFYKKGYDWGVALALEINIKLVFETTSSEDLPFLTTEDQLSKLFVDLSKRYGLLELITSKSDPDFVEAKIGFIDGFRKTFDGRLKEYIKKLS